MIARTIQEIDADIAAAEAAKDTAIRALKSLRTERRDVVKATAARAKLIGEHLARAAADGDDDAVAILARYGAVEVPDTGTDGGDHAAPADTAVGPVDPYAEGVA